jgi:Dolichyl-phosphate-mannose-protein mannosyltransferase
MQKEALRDAQLAAARSPQSGEPDGRLAICARDESSRAKWLLLGILVLAFGLRVWGINFGLPYELTYDEGKEIHRALKLGAGEYYWGFGKGGLYYILFVEYVLLYLIWWMADRVADTREFALHVIRDPTMFFLLGRLTVAVMGTLTCLVIFQFGRRVYDWKVGLLATFVGATAYAHATHSHIVNVDIGMTLAVWASVLAYIYYEETGQRRWLIGAGALAGVAIAFKLPGAVVLPALFLAIGSRSNNWRRPWLMLKQGGVILATTMATLTIVAPEWIFSLGSSLQPYFWLLQGNGSPRGAFSGEMKDSFRLVTTRGSHSWTGYLQMLFSDRNLLLTIAALAGGAIALLRKERWAIIWSVLIILFIGAMSVSSRGQPEYYLLPVLPCFWLLASRALVALSGHRTSVVLAGLACIVALPLVALVRQNHEWTHPDTRILAKEWVETNIPSGAKILADSFQYRFTPSPPLTPDQSTVLRQIQGVSSESKRFRGVSSTTLKLYAEAMGSISGPRYELHPTVWGLAVENPIYYTERCFDYIIASSMISKRYEAGINRERFPKSAHFYEQLDSDRRLQKIYSVEPIAWKHTGPKITVYKLLSSCTTSQRGTDDVVG